MAMSTRSLSHKGGQNGLEHMSAVMKSELLECSISGVPFSADDTSPHAPFLLKCGHTFAKATIERVRQPKLLWLLEPPLHDMRRQP